MLAVAAPARAASIGGTITDMVTGEGIEGVLACAYEAFPTEAEAGAGKRCSESEGGGEYLIGGVPAGSYKVGFLPESASNYVPEFYDDVDSWGEAEVVEVLPSSLTPGIDAALDEVESSESTQPTQPQGNSDAGVSVPPPVVAPPMILPVAPAPPPLRCKKG
ncbi:MAG TPA: hypothetical protein VN756_13095, partial [Solirubrobacterales bacterium]|nr:hypothetical protein [Solirubrobacterales bacterium]